jgi:hypothetical protein
MAAVTIQVGAVADARRMHEVQGTATTRPHLAAAMLRLAKPGPGRAE